MKVFYNLAIRFYYCAIFIAQLFNEKAKKWIQGRKNTFNLLPLSEIKDKKVVWFHCASLGEFDQAIPLIQLIKVNYPDSFLLLTFFSPSGMEHFHKRNIELDYVSYLPLDTPNNAKKWCKMINPKLSFFVKYEFWFNHIIEAKKYGEVYSICSLFRENQIYFKWYAKFMQNQLKKFSYFFVQNELSKSLLNNIEIFQVNVVGDMRFDRVLEHKSKAKKNEKVEEFLNGEKCWIIGSSWSVDEEFLENEINKMSLTKKIIIAPHDIGETHLQSIEKRFFGKIIRHSKWNKQNKKNILLIDCIGILNSLYQYADLAYVGGGFTGKLHNILEPAVYGIGIIIGPKYSRFPEAELLIKAGVVYAVDNKEDIEAKILYINQNLIEIAENSRILLESQKGVAQKIFSHLQQI